MNELARPMTAFPFGVMWSWLGSASLLLFFTNLSSYGFEQGFSPPPVVFYALMASAVCALTWLDPARGKTVFKERIPVWVAAFMGLSVIWYFFGPLDEAHGALLRQRLYCLSLLAATHLLWTVPEARTRAKKWLPWVVLLGVLFNLVDAIQPLTFSPFLGRSTGLYLNPNVSGVALLLGMLVAWEAVPAKWRAPFFGLVLIGILITFSRSAILFCLVVGAVLCAFKQFSWRQWWLTLLVVSGIAAMGAVILLASKWSLIGNDIMSDLTGRLWLTTDDYSSQERAYVAKEALHLIGTSPWIGHGTGASLLWGHEVSSHNLYLNLLVDHGAAGIWVIPGWVWALHPGRNRMAWLFTATLLGVGLVSHNVFDETAWIILMGFTPYFSSGPHPSEISL